MKIQSLKSLTIIYAVGSFSAKGISFFLIFFLTNYIDKSTIGQYDVIVSGVLLAGPCISLGVEYSVFRWLLDKDGKYSNQDILQSAFSILLIGILLFTILYFFIMEYITLDRNLILPVYIYCVLTVIFPFLQHVLRGIRENIIFISANIFYSFLFAACAILLVYFFNGGIVGLLWVNSFSLFVVCAYISYRIASTIRGLNFTFNFDLVKSLLRYSIPLLPNTLSWWMLSSAVKFIILVKLGQDFNGLFSILYKYPTILLLLSDVFVLAWQDKVISYESEIDLSTYFTDVLKKFISVVFGMGIILCCSSPFFFATLSDDYKNLYQLVPVLLLAVIFQAISGFLGAAFLRFKRSKDIFYSTVLSSLVTLVASFFAISYELLGICFGILLGYSVMVIVRILLLRKFLSFRIPVTSVCMFLLLYCIASFIVLLGDIFLTGTVLCVSVILLYITNIKVFTEIFNRKKIGSQHLYN